MDWLTVALALIAAGLALALAVAVLLVMRTRRQRDRWQSATWLRDNGPVKRDDEAKWLDPLPFAQPATGRAENTVDLAAHRAKRETRP